MPICTGEREVATNFTRATCGGRKNNVQPGIVVGPHTVGSPLWSCTDASACNRASAKYSCVTAPLLVTLTGIVTGVPACSSVPAGSPLAATCATLKRICAVKGCEVLVPDAK